MPDRTDRDRELARFAAVAIEHWMDLQEGLEKLSAQARREGREEVMETMKPELYRLGMVEVWARRRGGSIKVWAREALDEMDKPGGERHARGHLQRIIEAAQCLLDQPPEGEDNAG